MQAASVLQVHDTGRQLVAEVFEGFGLPQDKADAILVARSRIADQWGKAKHAALVIGQTLLELSRALSEDEYRRVLIGADRLFESRPLWQENFGGRRSSPSNCGCHQRNCRDTPRSTTWPA